MTYKISADLKIPISAASNGVFRNFLLRNALRSKYNNGLTPLLLFITGASPQDLRYAVKKSYRVLCQRIPVRYAWIKNHEGIFPISVMCRFMKVSRGGYYEWLTRLKSNREKEDKILLAIIDSLFKEGRGTYGTRRLKKKLAQQNRIVSRRRIGRLMAQGGIECKTKRKTKATTDSKHTLSISPNLLERKFNVSQKNRYWVGDITYIPTQEGWLYLAIVIDLYSRQIVGWSMDKRMKADLVNAALLMAIWQRKPPKGLIWHTDRGSQYAADSHRKILKDHGIYQSMSRKGNCWDNAVAESFFHTLKTELTHHCNFKNTQEARQMIFEYIEVFYNRVRIHSANDYLSPVEYERRQIYA